MLKKLEVQESGSLAGVERRTSGGVAALQPDGRGHDDGRDQLRAPDELPPPFGNRATSMSSAGAVQGLLYSLAFISVLSAFDLFWTTSHARNGHFQELNPFASAFLTDGASPWLFKVTRWP